MIKVENIEVSGWEAAIRGMRNPMNSWDRSDSTFVDVFEDEDFHTYYQRGIDIGPNDMDLMQRLYRGGSEHRKFMRMVNVTMDVTAPLYWWKEAATYGVGVVVNSCSTMHKIHSRDLTLEDFSFENITGEAACEAALKVVEAINFNRHMFIETKDKKFWWNMIQLLPSSYNQRRTIQMNYEVAVRIIHQRSGHKLDEWREFTGILEDLPYLSEIAGMSGRTDEE